MNRENQTHYRRFLMAGCVLACWALAGCSPVGMVIGAGASIANTASEDRGLDGAAQDLVVEGDVRSALDGAGYGILSDIGVRVRERRVLLTGWVKTEPEHQKILGVVVRVTGVAEVIDGVQVTANPDLVDTSHDMIIEQDIGLSVLFDGRVKSENYAIISRGRQVFIFGVAQSEDELNRVVAWVRNTAYVRSVYPVVRFKNDPARVAPGEVVTAVSTMRPQGLPLKAQERVMQEEAR